MALALYRDRGLHYFAAVDDFIGWYVAEIIVVYVYHEILDCLLVYFYITDDIHTSGLPFHIRLQFCSPDVRYSRRRRIWIDCKLSRGTLLPSATAVLQYCAMLFEHSYWLFASLNIDWLTSPTMIYLQPSMTKYECRP